MRNRSNTVDYRFKAIKNALKDGPITSNEIAAATGIERKDLNYIINNPKYYHLFTTIKRRGKRHVYKINTDPDATNQTYLKNKEIDLDELRLNKQHRLSTLFYTITTNRKASFLQTMNITEKGHNSCLKIIHAIDKNVTPMTVWELSKSTGLTLSAVNNALRRKSFGELFTRNKQSKKPAVYSLTALGHSEAVTHSKAPPVVDANSIDLGLSVLCNIANRGQTLSFTEIADVCECNQSYIQATANIALKKLRRNNEMRGYLNG